VILQRCGGLKSIRYHGRKFANLTETLIFLKNEPADEISFSESVRERFDVGRADTSPFATVGCRATHSVGGVDTSPKLIGLSIAAASLNP